MEGWTTLCVHDSVRIPAGPTGFSGGGFVFKFDGLVFNGPPAAAFAYVMKTVIFPEGLVIAWLLAAPCAALASRPASPEVWSCPSPVAMPAACFVAYVYVFIGALVAFTVEVTPVAHVTVRMSSTVGAASSFKPCVASMRFCAWKQ